MNFNLALDLLLYGLMLTGLSLAIQRNAPDFAGVRLIIAVASGLLLVLLGVLGLRGLRRLSWPIGILAIVTVLLLCETVKAWVAFTADSEGRKSVAVLLSLLLLFAVGQLVGLIQHRRNSGIKLVKFSHGTTDDVGKRPPRSEALSDE